MSEINFIPWIGDNYLSKGYKGKRILVLGESHYCKNELKQTGRCYPLCKKENMKDDCFSQTRDVVRSFVYNYSGEGYLQTFLCFERAVAGKVLSQQEREEFWQGVMFYNYIQYSQSGPRIAPNSEHWKKSEHAFKELLEEYLPDYIVVWGVRLYNGIPGMNGKESILQINEREKTKVWTYLVNGKLIPAIKVHHPSSRTGKKWNYWHEFYKIFFELSNIVD